MEASASTPLLAAEAPEPAWEQGTPTTGLFARRGSAAKKLVFLGMVNLLLIFAALYCQGLVFALMIMQIMQLIFGMLSIQLTGFSQTKRVAEKVDVSSTDLPRSCAICLGDFDDASDLEESASTPTAAEQGSVIVDRVGASGWQPGEIVRLQCDRAHCFHAGCIEAWLAKSGTCPLCRYRFFGS